MPSWRARAWSFIFTQPPERIRPECFNRPRYRMAANWVDFETRSTSVVASVGETAETRIIQQVASEACGLRMQAISGPRTVRLQTDPVRDCGKPPRRRNSRSLRKPMTLVEARSTPPSRRVWRAPNLPSQDVRDSVACGVVLGNEISVGGQPRLTNESHFAGCLGVPAACLSLVWLHDVSCFAGTGRIAARVILNAESIGPVAFEQKTGEIVTRDYASFAGFSAEALEANRPIY